MLPNIENILTRRLSIRAMLVLILLATVGATIQSYTCNTFNNYLVYTRPIINLISGTNLFLYHHTLYNDVFRYSPTFALIAGQLSRLPDFIGLLLWNLLNTGVFVSGLIYFLNTSGNQKKTIALALLLVFLEWLIACQNSQSNALLAGLILWGAGLLRKEKVVRSALMFALCGFIKFYGIAAAIVFLFFSRKFKFLVSIFMCCAVLAVLPLAAISVDSLMRQYKWWAEALWIVPYLSRYR